MKAVAALSPGKIEVVELPMPAIEDYECLVKVRACGFCATDLKIIDNHISNLTVRYPVILGHEGVGEVVEIGDKVRNIKLGDVFTNPYGRLAPGTLFNSMWANMVEYAVVQDREVMDELGVEKSRRVSGWERQVPPGISPIDAGCLLALREAYSGTANFGVAEGMDVLIYGDGPIALALANFSRMRGARWIGCVGHHAARLERIARFGQVDLTINSREDDVIAKMGKRRVDMAIDAVGSAAIIKEASKLLNPGGKVGVYGVLKKEDSTLSLIELRNNTSVHMLNWPYGEGAVHDEMVELIRRGKVNLKDYYTHVVPLAEAPRALELIRSREAFRVVLSV